MVNHVRVAAVVWALAAVAGLAEDGKKVYPLAPESGAGARRGGYARAKVGADGVAEVPFSTASGKLRVKPSKTTVQVDANDDGQFTDNESTRQGAPVSVSVKVGEKTVPYSLMVYGIGPNVGISSLTSLQATVNGVKVSLLDGNCNGRFGDLYTSAETPCDLIVAGDGQPKPLGQYAQIGTTLYQVSVLGGGAELQLEPYTGPTSKVDIKTADGYTLEGQLRNKKNGWTMDLKAGQTAATFPGDYTVVSLFLKSTANAKDGKGPALALYSRGGADLTIAEGASTLNFGPPLKLDFKAVRNAKGVSVKEVLLVGAGGETYRAGNRGSTMESEVRAGSEKIPGNKLSYG